MPELAITAVVATVTDETKDSVMVDDIRLTRAQVANAVELLATTVPEILAGSLVEDLTERMPMAQYLVLGRDETALVRLLTPAYGQIDPASVWVTDGITVWAKPRATLSVVGFLHGAPKTA